jgi:hypothetical protein
VPVILAILPDVTVRDLKELMSVESLASHSKNYIERELARRESGGKELAG